MKVACLVFNVLYDDWDVVKVLDDEWIERYAPEWKTSGVYQPPNQERERNIEIPDDSPVEGADPETGRGRYIHDGEGFFPIEGSLNRAKKYMLTRLAEARWRAETQGITLPSGIHIDTSRESQALITGAALAATLDSAAMYQWKTEQGFITLGAEQILNIAGAVRQHVQVCFDHEAELAALVEAAGTAEDVASITL